MVTTPKSEVLASWPSRELVSTMQKIRIRRQKPRSEPWWCWIDTRTPSGRVLPY